MNSKYEMELVFYLLDISLDETDADRFKSYEFKLNYLNYNGYLSPTLQINQIFSDALHLTKYSIIYMVVSYLCLFSGLASCMRIWRTLSIRKKTKKIFDSIPPEKRKNRFEENLLLTKPRKSHLMILKLQ